MCFKVVSGLKVYFFKSELIGVAMEDWVLMLADIMECKVGSLSTPYLCLPVCEKFR